MFDDVPLRVWLLIAIGAVGYRPARYIFRHIAHAPSRRDITRPAEDLSWRTNGQFVRSLATLAVLLGVAVFIFTPAAEQFARSPRLFPVVMTAIGAWALLTLVQGFATGRIEPLARGFHDAYDRHSHPKRYWASMAWNATLGCVLLWAGYQANGDASAQVVTDRCIHAKDVELPQQQLAACDELIALRPNDPDAHLQRGLILLDAWAFDQAAVDFTRAHELDRDDPWPLANRGLIRAWKREPAKAEADFEAVRSLDPSNPVMLRGEALLKKDAGDFEGAVERLTQSLARDPDNRFALRMRSDLYWELGEREKSIEDDQRWVQLNLQARKQAQ